MAAPEGTLRGCQAEHRALFAVEGCAQMNLGLALRRFGEQGLAQGATSILVDLRRCCYMDSTFLGTLLLLKRNTERLPCGCFALLAPSPECCQLLEQMGLEGLFAVTTDEEFAAGDWKCLCAEMDDTEAFQVNVLEAHVELANLPGRAGTPFKKVARFMAQEMEAKRCR